MAPPPKAITIAVRARVSSTSRLAAESFDCSPSRRARSSSAGDSNPNRHVNRGQSLGRELTHRVEERPGPSGLPLERLGEPDQIARVAGVELDHASRQKAVVRTNQTALRGLTIV